MRVLGRGREAIPARHRALRAAAGRTEFVSGCSGACLIPTGIILRMGRRNGNGDGRFATRVAPTAHRASRQADHGVRSRTRVGRPRDGDRSPRRLPDRSLRPHRHRPDRRTGRASRLDGLSPRRRGDRDAPRGSAVLLRTRHPPPLRPVLGRRPDPRRRAHHPSRARDRRAGGQRPDTRGLSHRALRRWQQHGDRRRQRLQAHDRRLSARLLGEFADRHVGDLAGPDLRHAGLRRPAAAQRARPSASYPLGGHLRRGRAAGPARTARAVQRRLQSPRLSRPGDGRDEGGSSLLSSVVLLSLPTTLLFSLGTSLPRARHCVAYPQHHRGRGHGMVEGGRSDRGTLAGGPDAGRHPRGDLSVG